MVANLSPRLPPNGPIDIGIQPTPGSGGAPRNRTPPAPTNVKITVKSNGTWTITWTDFRAPRVGLEDTNPVDSWIVGYCPATLVGPPSNTPTWPTDVQSKASMVGSVPSVGNGQTLSYFQSDTTPGDGYALIWGVGVTGSPGPPSAPLPVKVSTTTGAISADPRGIGGGLLVRKLALKDNNNFVIVRNMSFHGSPPAVTAEFGGFEVYAKGFNGTVDLYELGSMCPWNGTTSDHQWTVEHPLGSIVAQSNVHLINGNTAMTRNSGNNFSAPEVGCWFAAAGATADDTVSMAINYFFSVTDANNATLGNPWAFSTGNYDIAVMNIITYYINSISKAGVHRVDPTLAASLQW